MISGFATIDGTGRFAERFKNKVHKDFFRTVNGLTLSSLGLGTYLGDPTESDDKKTEEALKYAIQNGINVIDTAINYRCQRSERTIGRVLAELIKKKEIARDEIFIATKGGFIPFDNEQPDDAYEYFHQRYLKTKILTNPEVAVGCHSLGPKFIDHMFEQSRLNLGLENIDLYFLHNPETQLEEISKDELLHRIHRAFLILNHKVKEGKLHFTGVATWNAFRVGENSKELLDLQEIVEVASDHGAASCFKFIQLPFNLALSQAITVKNQHGKSVLEKARDLAIHVFSSGSLMQGQLTGELPAELEKYAPGESSNIVALNYARSAPGITVALCGMKRLEHVKSNLRLSQISRYK